MRAVNWAGSTSDSATPIPSRIREARNVRVQFPGRQPGAWTHVDADGFYLVDRTNGVERRNVSVNP